MNTSSRFIVAVHLLAVLAVRGKVKSNDMAWSVNTNPVVIRRILGALREAGLVHSQTGPNGGSTLARPADQITLANVYDAVEGGQLFHPLYSDPAAACPIGSNIEDCMATVFEETQAAVRDTLSTKTIAQIADDILTRTGIKKLLNTGLTMDQIQEQYMLQDGQAVQRPTPDTATADTATAD